MGRLAGFPFFKDAGVDLTSYESRCIWRRFDANEILVDFDLAWCLAAALVTAEAL